MILIGRVASQAPRSVHVQGGGVARRASVPRRRIVAESTNWGHDDAIDAVGGAIAAGLVAFDEGDLRCEVGL